MKKGWITVGISLVVFMAWSAKVWGEDIEKYPSRPITLTLAYAPGGSTDLISRVIAKVAEKYIKEPIVVMNKPGGAGLIALQYVASSKPDGYTLHLGRPAELSVGPLIEKMPFEVEKTFVPVAMMGQELVVFSVWAESPWKTIEDLVAAAKAEPEKIKYASTPTSTSRLVLEKFAYDVGIKLTHVPFKGAAPAAIAVAGGHVPVMPSAVGEALPHYRSNKIRILLVCSDKRAKEIPEVPTIKEKGYDVTVSMWWLTVFAHKDIPEPILKKVESLMKRIVEDKDFFNAMAQLAIEPTFMGMTDFAKYWEGERKVYGDIIQRIGLGKK